MADQTAIALLRRVRDACRSGEVLEPADAAELAERLEAYEAKAPAGARLDEILGLAPGPGRPTWPLVEAIARRNGIIRRLADEHLPGLSTARQAERIAEAANRFERGAWRHERHLKGDPRPDLRTFRGLLRAGFRAARFPLSARQIERILARSHDMNIEG